MTKIIADRVLETSTSTGSTAITLAGAVVGYRAASTVCSNGDTFTYHAEDVASNGVPTGTWETGVGQWGTGNTLTTLKLLASSTGSKISWVSGTRRVGLSLVADQLSRLAPQVKNYIGARVIAHEAQGTYPSAGSNTTWMLQCAVPDDYVALQIVIGSHHTSDITNVTCCASAGATATDRTNNSGTWTAGTFNNGSSTGTLPLAASTADPTITLTDWIPVQSIARGDGGSLKLAYVRIMIPLANSTIPLFGFGASMAGWRGKSDGMEWAWNFQAGDFVTTPSGMTGAGDPSNCPIIGIRYLTKNGATISNAFFGDSITSGTGATIPGDNWGHRSSTSFGGHASASNCGIAGQTMAQILTRMKRYLPLLKPTHTWLPTFSPNGAAITASVANQQYSQIMQMVDLCRQNNSQIILWSGCPRATSSANSASYYSNSDDDLRKNLALSLGGIGIPVCDIAAAMSDTNALGTASKWSSGAATSDGLHPSDAGYVTMASTALSTMHQFSP